MPLVELVPAPWTSKDVLSRTFTLMESIGQSPVILKKEVPGFIQPRVQYALIQECLKLVTVSIVTSFRIIRNKDHMHASKVI